MSSHKNREHLNAIKEAVIGSDTLKEDEKTDTIKRIDEWLLEDRASGTFAEELLELAPGIRAMLTELGLI